ncbi:hypothetical protein [Clavibacter sp. km1a]|uniref:hypothetical protein n=1 Tax=Clavibacter sp. km1a TaxID=3459136 RepID=UPI00404127FD
MSALLAGSGVLTLLAGAVGLVGGVLLLLVLRRMPRVAVSVWLAALCLLPVWTGVSAGGIHLPAASLAAILVIIAVSPVPGFRISPLDALVVLMGASALAGLLLGSDEKASLTTLVTFISYGVPGYLLGRLAAHRIGMPALQGIVAIAFTVVGALAVVEFATHVNPFISLPGNGGLRALWGTLQGRGGIVRAEGAFGHSIALGSSLAMAIPLTLASRFGLPARLAMTTVMVVGAVLTFSRVGMLGALLGLVLAIVFLRDAISLRVRVTVTAVVVVVVVAIAPFVRTVFDDAGTEATNSSDYRGDLYGLIPGMQVLGLAASAYRGTDGRVFYGGFRSIDSQLVLTGLTFGILSAIGVLIALAVGVVLVLRGRATAATIALVAQIPALASVALITQYSIFVWFLAGVAATSQILRREPARPEPDPVRDAAHSEDLHDPTRTTALAPPRKRTPSR